MGILEVQEVVTSRRILDLQNNGLQYKHADCWQFARDYVLDDYGTDGICILMGVAFCEVVTI